MKSEMWQMRDPSECLLWAYKTVNGRTGELASDANCGSMRCGRCAPLLAKRFRWDVAVRTGHLLQQGERVRFVTLTQVGENVRDELNGLRRELRRRGFRYESLDVVEKGEKTGMRHVHAIQHGDYVPHKTLLDVWGRGCRIEEARDIKRVGGYVSKSVSGYVLKGSREGLAEHVQLNRGRLAHWSRGWWGPGGRTRWQRSLGRPADDWRLVSENLNYCLLGTARK